MNYNRRDFVRTLFAASVAGRFIPSVLTRAETPPPAESLRFLVMGDWGERGSPDQTGVATQMAKAAADLKARFIVAAGDNFYQSGVVSVDDPQWKESFENVYTAPSLQVPWQAILGNHDYLGNCDAQIAYHRISPRWNMPARYYTQTQAVAPGVAADFFYVDTSPFLKSYRAEKRFQPEIATQDPAVQMAWLKEKLAASTAPWKIVVGHHPIYSGGDHGDTVELIEEMLPVLRAHGVQAYFNGHDHDLQHLVSDGFNMFNSGGGGARIYETRNIPQTQFGKSVTGFMTVDLQPETMIVQIIDGTGARLYVTSVPRVAKA